MNLSKIMRTITLWEYVVKALKWVRKTTWSEPWKKAFTVLIILLALTYNYQVILNRALQATAAVVPTIPYTFNPGTSILSAEMNANFQKIIDNALSAQSIATGQIADSAITAAKLGADAVTTAKILDQNVTKGKLASDIWGAGLLRLGDGTITADVGTLSLEDDSVTVAKMADGDHGDFTYASNVATIDTGAVTGAKILDGTITDADLAGSIATTKMLFTSPTLNEQYGYLSGGLWSFVYAAAPITVTETTTKAWTDLYLNGSFEDLPSGYVLAIIWATAQSAPGSTAISVHFRPNGQTWDTDLYVAANPGSGIYTTTSSTTIIVPTDVNQVLEYSVVEAPTVTSGNQITFSILGYIGPIPK